MKYFIKRANKLQEVEVDQTTAVKFISDLYPAQHVHSYVYARTLQVAETKPIVNANGDLLRTQS
jgi:hypothetical protein